MTASLSHIVEPLALLLVWQGTDESDHPNRTRRIVGKITPEQSNVAKLEYFVDSEDFRIANAQGFIGYPGLPASTTVHASKSVLEAFMRRLPPRRREDFADYLALHRLPNPFPYSDFALLGYTGAKLPSDGFSIVPVFDPDTTPCEYILEVAGVRHNCEHADAVAAGNRAELRIEHDNAFDPGAIAIHHNGNKIGYVNRALIPTVTKWLQGKTVQASIERKNGKPTRPLIYVRLAIH